MAFSLSKELREPSRRHELFFWVFATVVLFMFLGHNAIWASEERWAEITREMMLTGDYLHPAMNWRVYLDKPQLTYWLIVPVAWLFGGVLDEFVVRAPSALAALASLYGVLMLGKKLFDRRTALLAAWMTLSCYGFLFWARTAAADMANVAAIILAVAFFFQVEEKAKFHHYLVFYLICFLGALGKGLPALVMPFVVIAPHLLVGKRFLKHLKVSNFLAFFVAAGFYFTPLLLTSYIPLDAPLRLPPGVEVASGLELVWRENIVRVFNAFDHRDPFYSYLYNLPRILMPWMILIGVSIAGLIRNWKKLPPVVRELAIGTLLMFLLFMASTSRRWYYILPLAPFCTLLGAAGLTGLGVDKWNRPILLLMRVIVIVAASLGIASLVAIPLWGRFFDFELPLLFLIATPVVGVLALGVMLLDNQPNQPMEKLTGLPPRFGALMVGGAIIVAGVFCCILPSMTKFRVDKPFYLAFHKMMPDVLPEQIFFWRDDAPAEFLFYLNLPRPVADTPDDAWRDVIPADQFWKKNHAQRIEFIQQVNRNALKEFVERNAGRKVAIFTFDRQRDLDPLKQAIQELNIPLDIEKYDLSERDLDLFKNSKRNRVVWIIQLPVDEE